MPTDAGNAQDYTANGPTDIGFRTGGDGTGIDNGVVAQGKITGVTGIGLAAPGTFPVDQPIGVVGVVGKGQFGVMGLGHQPEGTFPDSSVGVFGQGGVGVRGSTEGAGGIGVDGGSTDGIGVNGFSRTNDAVVGTSSGERKSGVFGDNSQKDGEASGVSGRTNSPQGSGVFGFSDAGGIGVRGFSNSNDGVVGVSKAANKSGVFGENEELIETAFGVSGSCDSPEGAGIHGISVQGYGGHFRGGRAPLRLVPASTSGPPTIGNHQRGEFFVDSNSDLFFCKNTGTPGNWFRVPLTPA